MTKNTAWLRFLFLKKNYVAIGLLGHFPLVICTRELTCLLCSLPLCAHLNPQVPLRIQTAAMRLSIPLPSGQNGGERRGNDIFPNCRVLASRDRPRPRTDRWMEEGDGAQNFGRGKLLKMFGCRFPLCKLVRSGARAVGYILIQTINLLP